MRTVTPMDLRKRLGEILDAASAGEHILIERDHKPLAYLVSFEDGERIAGREERIARRLRALDELDEMAKEYRRAHPWQPDEMSAVESVRWDRDHRDDAKYERIFGRGDRAMPATDDDA